MRTLPGPSAHRRLQDLLHEEGAPLVLGDPIGQGANGVVRVGLQRRVGRHVAVKMPRKGQVESMAAVLQEGCIAGSLEHPSIVPVYDIRVVDGRPAVLMKRIDGVPWLTLIHHPEQLAERHQVADPLSWHLRTLIRVCQAMEYAHSRGVIHRDLKPANVMVGRFGEVWVVDWGTAGALRETDQALIPQAADQTTPCGTPAYMAPEQALGDGHRMDERTDVFCLGAVLYEVVRGEAPRRGTLAQVLLAAASEPIAVDPSWPLAPLLGASLSLAPADRPPSVQAFRQGIERWLGQQGAEQGLARAQEQLQALEEAAEDGTDRAELVDLYGAARFGFEQALEALPAHPEAIHGLRSAHLVMVDHALAQQDARAARLHLARVDSPPEGWEDRVSALEARRAQEQETLARLRADEDPRTAWWARLLICTALGSVWVLTPVGSLVMRLPQSFLRELFIAGATFVLSLMVMAVLWKYLVRSRLNRVLVVAVAAGPGLAFLLNIGGWLAGMDSQLSGTLELFSYFTVALFATLLGERRLIVGTLGFLLAFYLSMAFEGTTLLWMNLANLVMVINAVVIWAPMAWREEAPEDRPWVG